MKSRHFPPGAKLLVRGLLTAAMVLAGTSLALAAEGGGDGWSGPGKGFLLAAVDPKVAATKAAAAPATPARGQGVTLDQTQPFSNFPEIYRLKAREFDSKKNFRMALWQWEIVLAFDPSDAEAGQRAREIKAERQRLAEANFNKALALKEAGKAWPAFKAFVRTLAYDPTNQEALQNLKVDLNSKEFVAYTVQEGDTLEEIAKRELKDAKKSFLIPYFNRLGPGNSIAVGATLRLPVLASIVREQVSQELQASANIPPEPKVDSRLVAIRAMMENNQVQEAAQAAEEIVNVEPNNAEARRLANESYYRLGKGLGEEEKFAEAMGMFNRVKPDYRDIQQLISNLSGTMVEKAESAYIAGVTFFVNEELDQAIGQWEHSLVLNPDHPKARKDLERAKRLRAQLRGN